MSPALGLYLRRRDVLGPTKGVIHRRHLTPLPLTYSLAAYTAQGLYLGP
ncbi:hypothetical protein [Corallococcus sp. CA049B]|nr:hypothetical protein [Corallococcus sp. CA049B]